ncbi:hypothetical protein OOT08_03740 [Leucobacter sp. M11]|nr:hypothetical protein [Leucobacter sp. M11]
MEHLLHPLEHELVSTSAIRRRQSFALGRLTAKNALLALGQPVDAILRTPAGAPVWPEATRGSISHCDGLAVALVSTDAAITGVGIDVEVCRPLPPHVKAAMAARDFEYDELIGTPDLHRLPFTAREAAFKALPPAAQRRESVLDMDVSYQTLNEWSGEFRVRSGSLRSAKHVGRWERIGESHLMAWILVADS